MGKFIFVLIVVLVIFSVGVSAMIKRLLYICSPNEVLVFSGTRQFSGGREVGYKIIKGGRAIRIPLFEVVDRMDLTNMPIDLEVQAAYSKGGIPLNVVGIANVKIAGHQPILDHSIERFLGKSRNEVMLIAKDTLEGTLRGVLATLTPEEVNEDKIKFSEALLEEATDDLNRLGLSLDTLKIQDVSDDVKYLDSIGRKRSAEIQRKASIAEAEARSEARVREAQNHRETELKRIESMTETVKAENRRRVADATTTGMAMVAESRGQVAATLAQASAEVNVQKARIERERRRLSADVLEPARAEKAAKESQAKADAASIIEQGRAQAEAMRALSQTWREAGPRARDVFLVQKLEAVLTHSLSTMGDLKIDKVTVLGMGGGSGGGGGDGLGGDDPGLARKLIRGNEELRAALGVDLAQALLGKLGGNGHRRPSGPVPVPNEPTPDPDLPGSHSYSPAARTVKRIDEPQQSLDVDVERLAELQRRLELERQAAHTAQVEDQPKRSGRPRPRQRNRGGRPPRRRQQG